MRFGPTHLRMKRALTFHEKRRRGHPQIASQKRGRARGKKPALPVERNGQDALRRPEYLGDQGFVFRRTLARALVQHAEQPKQNDDGDRDADQPEENAAHR